jgi:hypothetical protein
MRRVPKPGARRRGGGEEIVVRHDADSRRSERTAVATDITLLGQGCGETLPSLCRIPASYRLETNGERLYRLCLALVERNLADAKLWQRTGKVAVVFARSSLQKLIEEFSGGALKDKIDYCFEVRDDLGTGYWRGGALDEGKLMAMFELQGCGYLKIGAALEALEEQERFLGAAFYYLLRRSLYRWIRIYDHTDAEAYNEQLHEWMEQDEPESQDAYEFPKVDEAIPEPVRAAKELTYPTARELLKRHLHGPHSVWIQKLLTLHRLSRLKGQAMRFEGEYDDPPVPSLLLVFRENDAIQACFDHESERYNETTNEPSCAVCFRPEVGEEFDAALRTMAIFLRVNMELAELITLLNNSEETNASQREHRTEPSLRAA